MSASAAWSLWFEVAFALTVVAALVLLGAYRVGVGPTGVTRFLKWLRQLAARPAAEPAVPLPRQAPDDAPTTPMATLVPQRSGGRSWLRVVLSDESAKR